MRDIVGNLGITGDKMGLREKLLTSILRRYILKTLMWIIEIKRADKHWKPCSVRDKVLLYLLFIYYTNKI
ncbi:hypothetical protein KQI38_09445 [Tissierella carlieri]|uniref:hypothetical protein n=1 Tax=Tissierella carlieri TaxID=689904 RepID=UPI001C10E207|nr:hypothetical protein [Tissierella carlieri]MBU5312251.1 hypothetical protein [Tissierella carlieri]